MIKFLCVYRRPGSRKHEGAIQIFKLLIKDWFPSDAWDITAERIRTVIGTADLILMLNMVAVPASFLMVIVYMHA